MIKSLLLCLSISCGLQAMEPDDALKKLMDGNQHFVNGKMTHTRYDLEAKSKMLEGQTPFAVIIGCSDSRVPPELIFDQGLGDLFVVRDAGNVIGPIELDSVEFAVVKLQTPIVVVMGHQGCAAVNAVLKGKTNVPELKNIFPLIEPAIEDCKSKKTVSLEDAVYCNVKQCMKVLKASATLAPYISQNKLKIVGAYFEIETGKVRLIP